MLVLEYHQIKQEEIQMSEKINNSGYDNNQTLIVKRNLDEPGVLTAEEKKLQKKVAFKEGKRDYVTGLAPNWADKPQHDDDRFVSELISGMDKAKEIDDTEHYEATQVADQKKKIEDDIDDDEADRSNENPEVIEKQAPEVQAERTRTSHEIAEKAIDPWKFVNENIQSSVEAGTWHPGKE